MKKILVLAVLLVTPASAHDHWINHGKYIDPTTGVHCCNEDDCKPLSNAEIESILRVEGGGLIVEGVTFQKRQLHNSEDGKWYRCAARCVFRPVEG